MWLKPILALGYRATVEAAVDAIDAGPGVVVVDLATGTGYVARTISRREPGARIIGLDLSPHLLREARHRARGPMLLVNAEASALPLKDASVDALVSTGSFHLFPRKQEALAEAFRVLRPGGRIALHAVPRTFPFTLLHCLLRTELREAISLTDRQGLEAMASAAGFQQVGVRRVPLGWLVGGVKASDASPSRPPPD
jgi:SAM-dependent methyltransferase